MKRLMLVTVWILCFFIAGTAFAFTQSSAQSATPVSEVMLYASPDAEAKVLKQLSPTTRFIPIFHQGIWTKVGTPSDGTVGWINAEQYRKAMKAYYQPKTQTITIQTERDENGKATVSVVAYQNGKKLPDKEAKALYQKMVKAEARVWKSDRELRTMDRFMRRQLQLMEDLFHQRSQDPGICRDSLPLAQPMLEVGSSENQSGQKVN